MNTISSINSKRNSSQNGKVSELMGIFILIGFYIGFIVVVRGKIPDAQTLLSLISELYKNYGYYLIFFGALLEATFLISLYLPGSTVVLLGAALSRTGAIQFPIVLSLAMLGFVIGYTINYVLGKYGWYHILTRFGFKKGIDVAKSKLESHRNKTILIGYFHPSSASFLSTAAGILKMPFYKFLMLSITAQLFWGILWGSLAYIFGLVLVELFMKYFGFVVAGVVVIWFLKKRLRK